MDERKEPVPDTIPVSHVRVIKKGEVVIWTTEAVVMLDGGPFLIGMYPFFEKKDSANKEVIWKWLVDLVGRETLSNVITVTDSFYVSPQNLDFLNQNGINFISSVHPQWFSALRTPLWAQIKKPLESTAMENRQKGLVIGAFHGPKIEPKTSGDNDDLELSCDFFCDKRAKRGQT